MCYVCVRVCLCVLQCVCVWRHAQTSAVSVCVCVCVFMYVYVYVLRVCMYVCVLVSDDILKRKVATWFTTWNDHPADVWEIAEILKSQLAIRFTMRNGYIADFWEGADFLKSQLTTTVAMHVFSHARSALHLLCKCIVWMWEFADIIKSQITIAFATTGWRRLIGSPKSQIIFDKRATKYTSRWRKMTCKDKGSYESSPPCTTFAIHVFSHAPSALHLIV